MQTGISEASISESNIPEGWHGTAATISAMQAMVSKGKRDWSLIWIASKLVGLCGHKDFQCFAESAFSFVKSSVAYMPDPRGIELVESPMKALERGASDCDGLSVLFNTLCEIMGMRTSFKTVKADASRPGEFTHVYSLVRVPKIGVLAADASVESSQLGWEPRGFESQVWGGSLEP